MRGPLVLLEWWDSQAGSLALPRHTSFDAELPEIELYDLSNKRCFLKRVPYDGVAGDLHWRQSHNIRSTNGDCHFADPYTKKIFAKKQRLLRRALTASRMGQIIDQIDKKFQMSRIKM